MIAVTVLGTGARAEDGDGPTREQLLQRIEQLETVAARVGGLEQRLAEVEAQRQRDWMSEGRREQVRALVEEVLADARTRSAALDGAITAGHNGRHFYLAGEDGSFTMAIGGHVQVRHVSNWRSDAADDTESGFQLRRTKVYFEGTVISPRVHYAVQFGAVRDTQNLATDKIVVGYDLTDTLHLWMGEDKGPFMREEMISSKRQLAVDRSLVNEAFTLDKVQGAGVKWAAHDRLRVQAMVHDGLRSGEAPGDDWVGDAWAGFGASRSKDFNDDATDYALAARVDFLLAGQWKQWNDFTSWPGEDWFAYVGAAVDYEHGETGGPAGNDHWLAWTVDAAIEVDGLSLSAAYVGAATDLGDGAPGGSNYQPWGIAAQAAWNFPWAADHQSIEPFVRYEHLDTDGLGGRLAAGQNARVNLLTVGANWYLHQHSAKFTADLVVAFDPLHSNIPGVSDGTGLLADTDGADGQTVLRMQYQLLF